MRVRRERETEGRETRSKVGTEIKILTDGLQRNSGGNYKVDGAGL